MKYWMNEERFVNILAVVAMMLIAVMVFVMGPKFMPEPIQFDDHIEDIELTEEAMEAYSELYEITFERS